MAKIKEMENQIFNRQLKKHKDDCFPYLLNTFVAQLFEAIEDIKLVLNF